MTAPSVYVPHAMTLLSLTPSRTHQKHFNSIYCFEPQNVSTTLQQLKGWWMSSGGEVSLWVYDIILYPLRASKSASKSHNALPLGHLKKLFYYMKIQKQASFFSSCSKKEENEVMPHVRCRSSVPLHAVRPQFLW